MVCSVGRHGPRVSRLCEATEFAEPRHREDNSLDPVDHSHNNAPSAEVECPEPQTNYASGLL